MLQNVQTEPDGVRRNSRRFLRFSSQTKTNRLYAAAPFSSKAVAFDEKGETGLKSDADFAKSAKRN